MKVLPQTVTELLRLAQHEALAYYKKGFCSNSEHPPLSYYVEVLAEPLRRSPRPEVIDAFLISADSMHKVATMPCKVGQAIGRYFAVGRGWIYPSAYDDDLRLMLNPGRKIFRRFLL
jgi:hypothetical protein